MEAGSLLCLLINQSESALASQTGRAIEPRLVQLRFQANSTARLAREQRS